MPEDDARNGLRVGGWIPPYSPGGGPAGPIRPTAHPYANAPHSRDSFPRLRGQATMRPRLVLAAALCLACAATAAIAVVLDAARDPEPVAAEFTFPAIPGGIPVFPPPLGSEDVPVSVQPSPTDTVPPATAGHRTTPPQTSPVATRTTTKTPTRPPATTRPTTPPPVRLNVGSTVGLEASDRPGYRVRHRDFRGRLDAINASSSAGERADSGFRVRTGLGDDDCVSLESVNFPGYYLRHRNFEIRLDRNDGSALFRQDATFCPVTIRQGAALALRSTNYPRHYVVSDNDRLRIVETTAAGATAFTPRNAL
jgi:hypothetical protein